jgi:pantoate--beta-alanine ligase
MIIFRKADRLSEYLRQQEKNGSSIGFVPTMGALHEGHFALVRNALPENRLTVCSIFVNPTQFNNPDDLKKYPITIERDIEGLEAAGCHVLFLPSVEEIYPPGHIKKHYELGPVEHVLEGFYRPGHFQGVSEVVDRLLEIVSPSRLYMGQKDFQQCMVVRKLLVLTGRETSVELKIVPTVREADGLAMSSRNLRLSGDERKLAAALYRELSEIRDRAPQADPASLKKAAADHLSKEGFQVDYVEIANQQDLSPATSFKGPVVALVAAGIGQVRLIDNLILS